MGSTVEKLKDYTIQSKLSKGLGVFAKVKRFFLMSDKEKQDFVNNIDEFIYGEKLP